MVGKNNFGYIVSPSGGMFKYEHWLSVKGFNDGFFFKSVNVFDSVNHQLVKNVDISKFYHKDWWIRSVFIP